MKFINNQKSLDKFIAKIANCDKIAVDTEFIRDNTFYANICLIQIAGGGEYAVIDTLIGLDLSGVFAILKNTKILKIFHAARQDMEIFYFLMKSLPKPIYDTQIIAATIGYGSQISYDSLIKQLLNIKISKSERCTDWTKRPLSDSQINYAAGDVTHLLKIYDIIKSEIEKLGREKVAAKEISFLYDENLYNPPAVDAWKRFKIRNNNKQYLARLYALAFWREEKARSKNIPRKWVIADDIITEIAISGKINSRSFSRGREGKNNIKNEILKIINEAYFIPKDMMQKENIRLNDDEIIIFDTLNLLLKILAKEHNISPQLIANNNDIKKIIKEKNIDFMDKYKKNIFGDKAKNFIDGKISISIQNNKLQIL